MENNSGSTSGGSSKMGDATPMSRYVLGFLAGVAASFIFIFVFMTMFTSNILDYAGDKAPAKKTADAGLNAPAGAEKVPDIKTVLAAAAQSAGISESDLQKCVDSGTFKQAVVDEENGGVSAGVQGTPNNIILYGNQVTQLSGAMPITEFEKVIDNYLNGNGAKNEQADIQVPPITDSDWVRGNKDAKVTIVEYSDIDCPFCKRHHPTLVDLMEKYDGKVKWVYRHFPLDQLHPNARTKAEATECAGDLGGQEAFWKFIDTLYAS